MAMFFGLHSSRIHFDSRCACSSHSLSSMVFWAIFSDIRIPTPPPLLLFLGFSAQRYPFIEIWSFLFIIVSVRRAIVICSVWSRDSRLLIFPFRPLTLTVAMVIFFVFPYSLSFNPILCFILIFTHVGSLVGLLFVILLHMGFRVHIVSFSWGGMVFVSFFPHCALVSGFCL